MPEGPSIVILREQAAPFTGRKVLRVGGNSKLDLSRMQGRRVREFRSWGKHFLIAFDGFAMRVHFMLFGSYRIDDPKEAAPRLRLDFGKAGAIDFYACSLKYIEGDLDETYDWSGDVMADAWDPAAARRKLKSKPATLACDALLDQDVFAGVGNIIKNEVLFRIRVQPESEVGALSPRKTERNDRAGPRIQLRFPGLEKGLRAAQALPGAYAHGLPALRAPVAVPGQARCTPAPRFLLRLLPAALPPAVAVQVQRQRKKSWAPLAA